MFDYRDNLDESDSQEKSHAFTIESEQDFPTLGDKEDEQELDVPLPAKETTLPGKPLSPLSQGVLFRSQVGRRRSKKKGGHQKAV